MNPSVTLTDRSLALRLFLALLLLYAALSGGHLYSMDDHTNFHVADSILARGSIDLEEASRARHLNTTTGADGRPYSYYGIGGPLVFLPFVALGRAAGALAGSSHYLSQASMSLASAVLTAATSALVFLILRRRGRSSRRALAAAALYALATPALVWSKYSANSVIVGFLFVGALYAFLHDSNRGWMVAGLCLGLAVNVRYDAAIGAALLPLLAMTRGDGARADRARRFASLGVALLPFALLLLGHNLLRFGSPWKLGYSNLESADPFGTPLLSGLYGLLLSPNRGLLFHAPILLILPFSFRQGMEKRWSLLLPAVYAVFYAKAETWDGGVVWGPRYLGCVLPLLCLPLGDAAAALVSRGRRDALIALAGLSVSMQLWGGIVSMDSYHDHLVESGINPLRTRDEVELAPVWGVRLVMRELTLEQLADRAGEGPLPAGGHPATVILRSTADYWPFYAYKLGFSPWPLILLWSLMVIGALLVSRPLWRAAGQEKMSLS